MATLPKDKFDSITWADDWGSISIDDELYQLDGSQVQSLIKKNVITALHTFESDDLSVYILGFANQFDKDAWLLTYQGREMDGLTDDRIICYTSFAKEAPKPYNIVNLKNLNDSTRIISIDGNISLNVRFESVMYYPATSSTEEITEDGTFTIQTRPNSNYSWTTVSNGSIPSNTDKTIDISNFINEGTYDVRIQVTNENGTMFTSWLVYKVTKTIMGLTFAKDWAKPQTGKLSLGFGILGAINKILHVEISGVGGENPRHITRSDIGSHVYDITTGSNAYEFEVTDTATDIYKVLTHGVHNIKAWLEVIETGEYTPAINVEVMMISDPNDKTPHLLLSNISDRLVNWTQQHIFDYAIYDPDNSNIDITFELKDYNTDDVYLRLGPESVITQQQHSYINSIEVENDNNFYAQMTFMSGDKQLREPMGFEIINVGEYGPTKGAKFIFDPKSRSNNETAESREVIYNGVNNQPIDSEWNGFKFSNDAWMETSVGKCLRVLSGQSLNIKYNPYLSIIGDTWEDNSCTIEMTVAIRNIINPEIPILRICDNNSNGITLCANELVVTSSGLNSKKDQDVVFGENTKLHIAVNYIYHIYSYETTENDLKVTKYLNLIRIFVNGCINREFAFSDNDFTTMVDDIADNRSILIGNTVDGADIDIYGMRVYKKKLDSDSIFNDYVTTISTIEEKEHILAMNNIFENGKINYDLARAKYNTILWKPLEREGSTATTKLASYINTGKYKGDLVISVLKEVDGKLVEDASRSGVIKDMQVKGQGTSSMNYWKWNQRWEFDKIATGEKDENDEDICYESLFYANDKSEPTGSWKVEDGCPRAKRIDGKINWASPMQSHKLGSTSLYHDLWKATVGGNAITKLGKGTESDGKWSGVSFTGTPNGYADCRVAIKQLPFLVFVQEEVGGDITFAGLYTVGASKGDKPTFGYNKKEPALKSFLMMEGCDNGAVLVNHEIPWNDEDIDIDKSDGVIFRYLNEKQWEVSMGDDSDEALFEEDGKTFKSGQLKLFRDMCNFVYSLNHNIHPFTGTNINDPEENAKLIKNHFYWLTKANNGANIYDLYRFDKKLNRWVNAGVEHNGEDYEVLNLAEQVKSVYVPTTGSYDDKNNKFIDARVQLFGKGIGNYIHIKDLQFTMQFLKLIAASDNWAKNTYIYSTGLDTDGNVEKFRFFQDDLDTIFASNNTGQKTKPYYVEEHDLNSEGSPFWNAQSNPLYCLSEKLWVNELPQMMYSILDAMKEIGGSVYDCFSKYYLDVQRYFPVKCYNEIARLLYEDAAVNYGAGIYTTNGALSQCLGNQLEAEKYWLSMRTPYISSYAMHGEFGARDGISSSGAMTFRSTLIDGLQHNYSFKFKPYIWLYPSLGKGSSDFPTGRPQRVPAGEIYTIDGLTTDGNTNIFIRGVNYYSNLGDLGNMATSLDRDGLSIQAFGERLTEFNVTDKDTDNGILFRPETLTMSTNMTNLKSINISGDVRDNRPILIGSYDISTLNKLEDVNLSATSITSIELPKDSSLKTLVLPGTLERITLHDHKFLTTLTISDCSKVTSLAISNCPSVDTYDVFKKCMIGDQLISLDIIDINWNDVTKEQIDYLLSIRNCKISGHITMKSDQVIDFNTKMKLIAKFGDIDNPDNLLTISYTKYALSDSDYVRIIGKSYVYTQGGHQFTLYYPSATTDISANDFSSIEWSLSSKNYGTISNDGIFTYNGKASGNVSIEITCRISRTGFSDIIKTKKVYLYQNLAKVGDYVYADGTYGDPDDDLGDKTKVAVCFYVEGNDVKTQKRLAVALDIPQTTSYWGLPTLDITNVPNCSNSGVTAQNSNMNDHYSFYLDKTAALNAIRDLKNKFAENTAIRDFGFNEDGIPCGKNNTTAIISERDIIIQNMQGLKPEKYEEKGYATEMEFLLYIFDQYTGEKKYSYFGPASLAYAYQPINLKDGEVLDDKFKAHNWFLPSAGEIVHLWYYLTFKKTADDNESDLNAFKQFEKIFNNTYEGYVWSSTEVSSSSAWSQQFKLNSTDRAYCYGYSNGGKTYAEKFCLPIVIF